MAVLIGCDRCPDHRYGDDRSTFGPAPNCRRSATSNHVFGNLRAIGCIWRAEDSPQSRVLSYLDIHGVEDARLMEEIEIA